jgi:hypothetical protein
MRYQTLKTNGTTFSPDELQTALLDVQDALERAQIQFIVLREAAYSLFFYEDLQGKDITVGVPYRQWMPECVTILKAWRPEIKEDKHGFHYFVNKVPVNIRIIHKNFGFLKDPDQRTYYDCALLIPNPFNNYWRSRSFV